MVLLWLSWRIFYTQIFSIAARLLVRTKYFPVVYLDYPSVKSLCICKYTYIYTQINVYFLCAWNFYEVIDSATVIFPMIHKHSGSLRWIRFRVELKKLYTRDFSSSLTIFKLCVRNCICLLVCSILCSLLFKPESTWPCCLHSVLQTFLIL